MMQIHQQALINTLKHIGFGIAYIIGILLIFVIAFNWPIYALVMFGIGGAARIFWVLYHSEKQRLEAESIAAESNTSRVQRVMAQHRNQMADCEQREQRVMAQHRNQMADRNSDQ